MYCARSPSGTGAGGSTGLMTGDAGSAGGATMSEPSSPSLGGAGGIAALFLVNKPILF